MNTEHHNIIKYLPIEPLTTQWLVHCLSTCLRFDAYRVNGESGWILESISPATDELV